jgi:Xaa-Pro dipeptidase
MPHGLGHQLGLYTHDLPGERTKNGPLNPVDKSYIRFNRKLETDMVITVEPGIYFIESSLEKA